MSNELLPDGQVKNTYAQLEKKVDELPEGEDKVLAGVALVLVKDLHLTLRKIASK